jgi:glycosyltransferase involved in cell wall biosynthesis
MRKLWYMGLEPYEGRYTLQLEQWSEKTFKARGLDYEIIRGDTLDDSKAIVTGQVLDAHGRSYYSLTQMARLVQKMKNGEVSTDDVIFFEDMFTPGIESLPYIMDQCLSQNPQVYVRCLAQTIDPDDFLHVWGMDDWMRKYEQMLLPWVTVLASNEEMVAHMRIAGWDAPIYNIAGLAFDRDEVRSRVKEIIPFDKRQKRVVFAARFDDEKQPHWFMDLIERFKKSHPDVEFAVLSGGPLRSNNEIALERGRQLEKKGLLKIYENLKKNEYYELMVNSRVLFNCALQDWTSNTASEADALETNCLYPAYRSFPETFANDPNCLYIPWSMDDATDKLENLLDKPHYNIGRLSDWTSNTINRCIDIMTHENLDGFRSYKNYRENIPNAKY